MQAAEACPTPAPAHPIAYKLGEVLPILGQHSRRLPSRIGGKFLRPKPFKVRPPEGAPNILLILLDQVSYADPSTFGGPINFPTLDGLAKEGLTYTNFHVNSLCSPSRTALLTGRNQHQNSQATVVDSATSYPGDSGQRPKSIAPIAEFFGSGGTAPPCSERAMRRRRGN